MDFVNRILSLSSGSFINDIKSRIFFEEGLINIDLYNRYRNKKSRMSDLEENAKLVEELIEEEEINSESMIEYEENFLKQKEDAKKRFEKNITPIAEDFYLIIYFNNDYKNKYLSYTYFFLGENKKIAATKVPAELRSKIKIHPYRTLKYLENIRKKIRECKNECDTLLKKSKIEFSEEKIEEEIRKINEMKKIPSIQKYCFINNDDGKFYVNQFFIFLPYLLKLFVIHLPKLIP